jgi:hypothetical protein
VLAYGDNEAGLEALRLLDRLGAAQAAQRVRRQLGAGHSPKTRAKRLPPTGPD